MADSRWARYRRRGGTKASVRTGHAALWSVAPSVDLEEFKEGGGFPRGFLQLAYRSLGVTDPARVLHVCSGSVRGPFTVDIRASVRPAAVADARALPFQDDSFRWVIADPPYSRTWAKALYGVGARGYPTPGGIVREAMRLLVPGGRLGLLHYMVPPYAAADARLVGVWGVTLGPGSQIRAWTVLERVPEQSVIAFPVEGLRTAGVPVTGEGGQGREAPKGSLDGPLQNTPSLDAGAVGSDEPDGPQVNLGLRVGARGVYHRALCVQQGRYLGGGGC